MLEELLEETGFIPTKQNKRLNALNGVLLGLNRAKEKLGGETPEIDLQIKQILKKLGE